MIRHRRRRAVGRLKPNDITLELSECLAKIGEARKVMYALKLREDQRTSFMEAFGVAEALIVALDQERKAKKATKRRP